MSSSLEGPPSTTEPPALTIVRLKRELATALLQIEELGGKRARKTSEIASAARGFHKVVSPFESPADLQGEADRRSDYGDQTTDPQDQRAYIRTIIPKGEEELHAFYALVEARADTARGDDISKIKSSVAEWLNASPYNCDPPLSFHDRKGRGFDNKVTGRALCPIEYDYSNTQVRDKVHAGHPDFLVGNSFYVHAFYPPNKGNPNDVEHLFLRGPLLLKISSRMSMTTAGKGIPHPHRRGKDNTGKATKSNVATLLRMKGQISPRAIAYAAVLLHFNLTNATQWVEQRGGVSYPALYNFIIDYFEGYDPATAEGQLAKAQGDVLLKWYNDRVFPNKAISLGNTQASYDKLAAQRAAKVAAARAAASATSS
ncbi:hypothetical protein EV122DRAFT_256013 [Schizophyllum commune]|nr:hypothetical protein K525DRAFT_245418 [Schizophyllum commune Loenen D]